jgi:hypothetical protein
MNFSVFSPLDGKFGSSMLVPEEYEHHVLHQTRKLVYRFKSEGLSSLLWTSSLGRCLSGK